METTYGVMAVAHAAIDACPARTERTLYTRWRAIGFLVRVRYEDQPRLEQPATSSAVRSNGGKVRPREFLRTRGDTPARCPPRRP
jgi:hypothetical protein